jgi:ubiquinone/menaquinone biosynthesis C-methylase UbiE
MNIKMVQIAIPLKTETGTGSFYDQIAKLYNITFKFNGYGRSLDHYLRHHPLPLKPGARILDAGCGTGLLTLALLKALSVPVNIAAVDLSASSIETAREAVAETAGQRTRHHVNFTQANVLALPFADDSFDLIVTSGALEYVPLSDGFSELARVIKPGGYLLHLPVKPSPISTLLEVLFRFKAHPPQEVTQNTTRYFRIVKNYEFPPLHPIGWSKTAVLAQKV